MFFGKDQFSGQTVDFRLQHVTLIWKAYASAVKLKLFGNHFSASYEVSRVLLANYTELSTTSETLSYGEAILKKATEKLSAIF